MTDFVACDISEYQVLADDTYPHRWLSFRICDGDYLDGNAAANLIWATGARSAGRLDGFVVYVVYRPGQNAAILAHLDQLAVPDDCVVMIDAETWGGQITGDHSAELNDLAERLLTRQSGRADLIWGYGNRNDVATLWAARPTWLGFDIASYGGGTPQPPTGDNLAAWQYTNGQYTVAGLPSSSPPFGPCDHNVFYSPPAQGADMTLEEHNALMAALNILKTGRVDGNTTDWPYPFTPTAALINDMNALTSKVAGLPSAPSAADIAKAVVAAQPAAVAANIDEATLAADLEALIAQHITLAVKP